MFCTNCGQELSDDKKFCTKCGEPVTPSSQTAQPGTVKPASASSTVQQHAPATPQYVSASPASSVSQTAQPTPQIAGSGVEKSKAPLIIVLLLVVIAAVVVAALFIMQQSKGEEEKETTITLMEEAEQQDAQESTVQEDAANSQSTQATEDPLQDSSTTPSAANTQDYNTSTTNKKGVTTYVNKRYGFSIASSKKFTMSDYGSDGSGMALYNAAQQMRITIQGESNPNNYSTKHFYEQLLAKCGNAKGVYKALDKKWCVVSWDEGNTTYYYRYDVGEGSIVSIVYTYPKSKAGNRLLEKTIKTFASGNLKIAH